MDKPLKNSSNFNLLGFTWKVSNNPVEPVVPNGAPSTVKYKL